MQFGHMKDILLGHLLQSPPSKLLNNNATHSNDFHNTIIIQMQWRSGITTYLSNIALQGVMYYVAPESMIHFQMDLDL